MKAFRPSVHKVYHLDVHPTQPWLVTSDGGDNVVVWDWHNHQVLYELNAAGVDERRLVDSQLTKLAEGDPDAKTRDAGAEAIRGGGVKDVKFYDDDVRFWSQWLSRAAASEAPKASAMAQSLPAIGATPGVLRGRRFLVMCCEYKAIFLDLTTMRARDVTKAQLENRSPLCVDFIPRSAGGGDGPFAAIGGPDGVIRVLSIASWQIVRKHVGAHKGAVHCLLTYMAANGEIFLVSGGSDGTLVQWSTENQGNSVTKEVGPKITIPKAHDGGVISIALARVMGEAPQLITCGADKSVVIWDALQFRELRRVKPVAKMVVNAVASWRHPGEPNIDVLATVKDSHLWAIDHTGYTRSFCDFAQQIPATPQLAAGKKLKMYCMVVHPLQPHLLAVGTNMGVIMAQFAPKCIPPAVALPPPPGSREQFVICASNKSLYAVSFQVAGPGGPIIASGGPPPGASEGPHSGEHPAGLLNLSANKGRPDSADSSAPQVRQSKVRVGSTENSGYVQLAISKSGKYISAVWLDKPAFTIYRVSDWYVVDSGTARFFAWDTCEDRYALVPTVPFPQYDRVSFTRGLRSSKKKEAIEREAQKSYALMRASIATANVEVSRISEGGVSTNICRSLKGDFHGKSNFQQVLSLQGGAVLGVAYNSKQRPDGSSQSAALPTASTVSSGSSVSESAQKGLPDEVAAGKSSSANFFLYSWESFEPVGGPLMQPEWSAWDPSVEYCALAYASCVVIATLRPQFRYLGNVAIKAATSGVWHRRQLFLTTPTSIECVFVDAGVSEVDFERKREKVEKRRKDAEAKAVAERGELAILALEPPKAEAPVGRVQLRPAMLQVVRLASFQTLPSVPPISAMAKVKTEAEQAVAGLLDGPEVRAPEVVVGGGGLSVAATRLPMEQRRPVGPVLVVGVRDGVLWLIDRFMTAHAVGLSHPGIRCRCLAAHGDPVSAVKWASRLGREHHDDMAQFLVGMGYAREALHLPGISTRFELDLAMQCGELQRALKCLHVLSSLSGSSRDVQDATPTPLIPDTTGVLALAATHSRTLEQVAGVARLAREYLELIDAADATGQKEIAAKALRRLAGAAVVEGALEPQEHRALTLRLAAHGEYTWLQMQGTALVRAVQGGEAALVAALLGDANLLEKTWQETGMLPLAALHAQAHGRPSLQILAEQWNRLLKKGQTSAGPAQRPKLAQFGALFGALPKPDNNVAMGKLNLQGRQPLVEVTPPGNVAANSGSEQAPLGFVDFGGGMAMGGGIGIGGGGGGVQGLRQPLDLSVLEGSGSGPAPMKGPPTIAVPLDFSVFEKAVPSNIWKPEGQKVTESATSLQPDVPDFPDFPVVESPTVSETPSVSETRSVNIGSTENSSVEFRTGGLFVGNGGNSGWVGDNNSKEQEVQKEREVPKGLDGPGGDSNSVVEEEQRRSMAYNEPRAQPPAPVTPGKTSKSRLRRFGW